MAIFDRDDIAQITEGRIWRRDSLRPRRGCGYRTIDIAFQVIGVDAGHLIKIRLIALNGRIRECGRRIIC
jgi:hypothetical protein